MQFRPHWPQQAVRYILFKKISARLNNWMMSSQYLLIQQVKQNCSRGYGGLLRPGEKLKLHFKLKLLEKKAFRTNKRKKQF